MKIAILDALPRVYWSDDNGYTDGEKIRDLLEPVMPDASFDLFYVTEGELPQDIHRYTGFISSGSSASVHDSEPWITELSTLLDTAASARKKIIGICFSHQLIAKIHGGEVIANEQGWLIGNYPLSIEGSRTWMQPEVSATSVHHFNQERVSKLPANASAFAHSKLYRNFAYTIGNHILCVQGHPEQATVSVSNWLEASKELLQADELHKAREMVADGSPDQSLWADWFSRFLQQT